MAGIEQSELRVCRYPQTYSSVVVRASTAAPLYFPPQEIQVGSEKQVFVDGGITSYNNPAFQLFLESTLEVYRLGWPTGEKKMLLVSIGTGRHPNAQPGLRAEDVDFKSAAEGAPKAMFNAALYQQDLLCRVFGRCLAGDWLDDEVTDLMKSRGPLEPDRLFSYVRYNATLTEEGLRELGPDAASIKPEDVRSTDSVDHMPELQTIGRSVADLKGQGRALREVPRLAPGELAIEQIAQRFGLDGLEQELVAMRVGLGDALRRRAAGDE